MNKDLSYYQSRVFELFSENPESFYALVDDDQERFQLYYNDLPFTEVMSFPDQTWPAIVYYLMSSVVLGTCEPQILYDLSGNISYPMIDEFTHRCTFSELLKL